MEMESFPAEANDEENLRRTGESSGHAINLLRMVVDTEVE